MRVRDRQGDWVVKRTGLVHSTADAIAAWLLALRRDGVDVVAPAAEFAPNPRRLDDGRFWVVYPYVKGGPYAREAEQLHAAGALLGRLHAADRIEALSLATIETPVVRTPEWQSRHRTDGETVMRESGLCDRAYGSLVAERSARARSITGLPLAGCSFDFKASNLVFAPRPVLVDPDHAARIPRLYDLAVAALLFHNDHHQAPGRLWTTAEWFAFMKGYGGNVRLTGAERSAWPDVLALAWLDQAVWLIANFPEGWAEPKEARYLFDLATVDLSRFPMP